MSDYDQLEFRHLKYIQAVAEEGSFTAASSRVNISQSTISTQIKQLEDVLGVEFFARDREVALTPFGQILLAAGRDLLDLREEVIDILRALGTGEIMPLRLGFSSLVEKRMLGSTTDIIRRTFPFCDILTDGDEVQALVARVEAGDLDGALVTLPIEHTSNLTTRIIERDPLYVCMRCDDPLSEHDAIPAHPLNGKLSLFQYPKAHQAAYIRMLELLDGVGVTPKKSNPTSDRDHIQWMVLQRQCYAFVRKGAKLMSGLTCRPIHGVDWTVDTAVIVKPRSQHPGMVMLLRELKKHSVQAGSRWVSQMGKVDEVRDRKRKPQSAHRKHNDRPSLFEAG